MSRLASRGRGLWRGRWPSAVRSPGGAFVLSAVAFVLGGGDADPDPRLEFLAGFADHARVELPQDEPGAELAFVSDPPRRVALLDGDDGGLVLGALQRALAQLE